jgi:MFS family permease
MRHAHGRPISGTICLAETAPTCHFPAQMAETQSPQSLAAPTGAARRPFILIFCSLCAIFALGQFHRSAGGVLAPVLNEELGLGAARIAIVTSALFLMQGLAQLPVGVLLDRFGPRATIPTLAALGGIGSCVFALSDGWLGLVAGRMLIGTGFAAVMMGGYVLFTRWVAPDRFSTVSGRLLFIGGAGGLVATTPLAFSIEQVGWRGTFLGLGLATFAMCAVTYAIIRDAPGSGSARPAPLPRAPATMREAVRGLGSVLRTPTIWPLLAVGLCLYSPAQVLLGIWAGPFLRDIHQLGPLERSHILLVMALAMSSGALIFGPLERWLGMRKRLVLAVFALIALLFVALAAFAHASLAATIALFVVILLASPVFVVVIAHCQAMFPRELAGRAIACLNMSAILGIVLLQNATGFVIAAVPHGDGTGALLGYRLVFVTMAAVFAAATLLYARISEVEPGAAAG